MEVNKAKRMRELELENNKLKRILADRVLEVEALKDVVSKRMSFQKVVGPTGKRKVVSHLMPQHQLSERAYRA